MATKPVTLELWTVEVAALVGGGWGVTASYDARGWGGGSVHVDLGNRATLAEACVLAAEASPTHEVP